MPPNHGEGPSCPSQYAVGIYTSMLKKRLVRHWDDNNLDLKMDSHLKTNTNYKATLGARKKDKTKRSKMFSTRKSE